MGLEKAIESGKEHRKPYRGRKRFAWSCRNGNGCPWCEGNRLHSSKCREAAAKEQLKTIEEYYDKSERTCTQILQRNGFRFKT